MDVRDVTKEEFNTLILIRSLEEFITDEYDNLSNISEAIWTLEESLSDEEHRQIVSDICKLTEKGYLLSDGTDEDIELDKIPEVKGITPKGQSALNQWEQEIKENMAGKERGDAVTNVNFNTTVNIQGVSVNFLKLSPSLISIKNGLFGALGSIAGNMIKEMLKK